MKVLFPPTVKPRPTEGPKYRESQLTHLYSLGVKDFLESGHLNLLHLPTETSFHLAQYHTNRTEAVVAADASPRKRVIITYSGSDVPTDLFDGKGTLCGSKINTQTFSAGTPIYGTAFPEITVRLRHRSGGSRGFVERVNCHLLPNGAPKNAVANIISYVTDHGGSDHARVEQIAAHMRSSPNQYAFIDSSSLRFPAKFLGRESVSFAGLPVGTKFMTKSGGKFCIVRRTGDTDHGVSFEVEAMDEASFIIGEEAFARETGESYHVVPHTLISRNERKHRVLTETIRCPFRDPIIDNIYYSPTTLLSERKSEVFPLVSTEAKSIHDECTEYNPMSQKAKLKIERLLSGGVAATDLESFLYG